MRMGTGHGVGYLLNVHERPNGFRWKMVPERMENAVLEEGMLTATGHRKKTEMISHPGEITEP